MNGLLMPLPALPLPPYTTSLLLLGIARVMKGFVVSSSWCLLCVCVCVCVTQPQWGNGKTQIGKVIAVVGILFFCLCVPSFSAAASVCRFFQPLLLHLLPQRFSGCQQQLPAGQRLGKHLNAFSCFASFPKEIVCLSASCLLPAACCMPHVACPMLPVSPLRLAMLRF